jgi:uncharacterized protein (UPF0548 family)
VPIRIVRPNQAELERLAVGLRDRPLTYPEVGATRNRELPPGYHHDRAAVALGSGSEVWAKLQDALRSWQGHRHAGASISPPNAAIEAGTLVVVTIRFGPMHMTAPCRIVYTTPETDSFGFGYGTLPGHPESGEEAFHVVRSASDAIRFEITAFSRPATSLSRIGTPIGRAIQLKTTRNYLEGIRRYVSGRE